MRTPDGGRVLRAAQEKLARNTKGSGELYERCRHLMPGESPATSFLLSEGVLTHPRHSFLSNAHGDTEIGAIVQGYDRSLREIQAAA